MGHVQFFFCVFFPDPAKPTRLAKMDGKLVIFHIFLSYNDVVYPPIDSQLLGGFSPIHLQK